MAPPRAGKKETEPKKTDPNKPKRPLSAYFLWMQENRETLKKEGMSVTEVAKAGGAAWKALTDKSEWEKKAAAAKAKYEKDMAAYNGK